MFPSLKLPPFDPSGRYTSARTVTINGVHYAPGDVIETAGMLPGRMKTLYEFRMIKLVEVRAMNPSPEEVHIPPPVRPPVMNREQRRAREQLTNGR